MSTSSNAIIMATLLLCCLPTIVTSQSSISITALSLTVLTVKPTIVHSASTTAAGSLTATTTTLLATLIIIPHSTTSTSLANLFPCPRNQYLPSSSSSCSQLFSPNSLDVGTVCATISIPNDPNKQCIPAGLGFDAAAQQCVSYGMRLCQDVELKSPATTYVRGQAPNCKFPTSTLPFVWTSTPCTMTNNNNNPGRIGLSYAANVNNPSSACHDSSGGGEVGASICCADRTVDLTSCAACPSGTYTAPPTIRSTTLSGLESCSAKYTPPNIVFLISDDLNTVAVGAYGEDDRTNTPNLDQFASESIVFTNAHAAMAMCTPSRSAFLTSILPERTGVITIHNNMRGLLPGLVTLPERFKQNGYYSLGVGKVFDGRSTGGSHVQDAISWSRIVFNPRPDGSDSLMNMPPGQCLSQPLTDPLSPPQPATTQCCAADVCNDESYTDGKLADHAVQFLTQLPDNNIPFFLAVGLYRPHLPFTSPEQYWSQWSRDQFDHDLSYRIPTGGCYGLALNMNNEPMSYSDWAHISNPIAPSPDLRSRFVHGYFSAVSYMDAQMEKILQTVKSTPRLRDNTIIIMIGDHGYHLGDHRMYGKKSVYEHATHTVLMVGGSAIASNLAGTQITEPVSLMDIYPTLLDVVFGVRDPQLDGETFALALRDPTAFEKNPSRLFAIAEWPARGSRSVMSYTLRGRDWKYVAHIGGLSGMRHGPLVYDELYDMTTTGAGETSNIVASNPLGKIFRDFFMTQVIVDQRFSVLRSQGVDGQVQSLVDSVFGGQRP